MSHHMTITSSHYVASVFVVFFQHVTSVFDEISMLSQAKRWTFTCGHDQKVEISILSPEFHSNKEQWHPHCLKWVNLVVFCMSHQFLLFCHICHIMLHQFTTTFRKIFCVWCLNEFFACFYCFQYVQTYICKGGFNISGSFAFKIWPEMTKKLSAFLENCIYGVWMGIYIYGVSIEYFVDVVWVQCIGGMPWQGKNWTHYFWAWIARETQYIRSLIKAFSFQSTHTFLAFHCVLGPFFLFLTL